MTNDFFNDLFNDGEANDFPNDLFNDKFPKTRFSIPIFLFCLN